MMGNGYVKGKDGNWKQKSGRGYRQTDGVSEYSRDYWSDLKTKGGQYDRAIHETLAEIARLQYTAKQSGVPTEYRHWRLGEAEGKPAYFATGKDTNKLSPEWSNLYKLVHANWKQRNKK
jgi:hypothetical protein